MRDYAKGDWRLYYPAGEVSDTDDAFDDYTEEKADVDEEDDLIKALKVAREKNIRNSPPGIETSKLITDLSFHQEADILANISSVTAML